LRNGWEGYSILGNGNLTVVYSDDPRISAKTGATGVQHLYFRDYTADYVAATSFKLIDQGGNVLATHEKSQIGMKNFFTAQTQTRLSNGSSVTVLCMVHPRDAVILSLQVDGAAEKIGYRFEAQFRNPIKTDRNISLISFETEANAAIATWSNGIAIAVLSTSTHARISVHGSSVSVSGDVTSRRPEEVILIPGSSVAELRAKIRALRHDEDLAIEAAEHWEQWMDAGKVPSFQKNDQQSAEYVEAFKRNLYCVKSANLRGQIPADITGQFVTNNMPQLYPRDAMMCARVFLATGHATEARQVIEFWANSAVPMKNPGEWYARYDAHGKAVDAGSGARYDEPEWDANGYFIYLVNQYHELTGKWLAPKALIYELADFLVNHLDSNGLVYEGGIVEWTGYLPATNMIDSASLKKAATIAQKFGDTARAASYAKAANTIAEAMPQMFDKTRGAYADVRFARSNGANSESIADKLGTNAYLWDTTANVGTIWGFPDHPAIAASNVFYADHTVGMGGGMRYFDSPDPGLADYGHGFFFFTTAAAAEYEFLRRNNAAGKIFLDWMLRNANSYGLMPEHISPDGLHCSAATPLSWCSAEFAAAVMLLSEALR